MNIFSHPAYAPTDNYITTGYNLVKSAAVGNAPNLYGPWTSVQSNYTSNLAVVDPTGSYWDLYRVQPIIKLGTNQPLTLDFSRAFFAHTPLYDTQVNFMLDMFRRNWLEDPGIRATDSTIPQESTGQGAAPFITDASTRFYLGFIPNEDPVRFISEDTIVWSGVAADGSNAAPLTPYVDYFPNGDNGYLDFKVNPTPGSYLRAEYTTVTYTNEQLRTMLVSAVADLSSYQINNYGISNSFNYTFLQIPLPHADLANILCALALRKNLGGAILTSFAAAESWKTGKVEYTADPSRSIQAGTLWHGPQGLGQQIKEMCNSYIINTRQYAARGEFDSFFDQSGIIPVYNSYFNVFNFYSWWL